jgi:hypothetical protein
MEKNIQRMTENRSKPVTGDNQFSSVAKMAIQFIVKSRPQTAPCRPNSGKRA